MKRTGAHVSPDRIVDAATCLLPNNTWFFKGVAHVNFWYDSQATKFLAGLITNPKKKQSVQTVKPPPATASLSIRTRSKISFPLAPARAQTAAVQRTPIPRTPRPQLLSPLPPAPIGAWQWAAPVWPPPACSSPCTLCLPKRKTTQPQNNIYT